MTVLHQGYAAEVTTYRADGVYINGRRPETVQFISSLSEDLRRRDFTVNAMAMDSAGKLVDPYGGQADLDAGLIRCVGRPEARFQEDALRMLRGIRFSAQLGFAIEDSTGCRPWSVARLCAECLSAELHSRRDRKNSAFRPARAGAGYGRAWNAEGRGSRGGRLLAGPAENNAGPTGPVGAASAAGTSAGSV